MRITRTKFVVNPAILPSAETIAALRTVTSRSGAQVFDRGSSVDSTGRLCNPQSPAWAVCGAMATPLRG
jgi:hypothetical protein